MTARAYRILNVFTVPELPFSGNALCVFEDGGGLADATMQALARQLNLSETTFLLPRTTELATARVRIFTPTFEMPFAGHPTLGTAHVVRGLMACGDRVTLEMIAGHVEVTAVGDVWTLRAAHGPEIRAPEGSRAELAATLGVEESALGANPLWVDTGAEQLVVPLRTVTDVVGAKPDASLLARHGFSKKRGASMVYVWARESSERIVARFFFLSNGSVIEDPATGSACANLGGWMIAAKQPLPTKAEVRQGDAVGRPSLLKLYVDETEQIFVSGGVTELGGGSLEVI